MMRGEFHFCHNDRLEEIKNTICKDGANMFGQLLFQNTAFTNGTALYLGLTNSALDFNSDLTDAAADEISGHGYARQSLTRNSDNWTVELVNGIYRARSASVTFTASDDWSSPYSRAFLCDVSSGTSGKLIAASGPTASPISILSGLGPVVSYIFNLNS